ncbi:MULTISPECIES: HPF/RaiA family ribosome-associated protein [unclassified Polaromonas]|jgi:ribosome-associated translation inhibitor RaiA|uniref:HPF/RaiA family ribosome-associated protein n=1 Tax=unclassified Polaromonas TaxID=2638319 RepID=UPI000F073ED5|nr:MULTISPECIES: HPF/RaiA family ribosome-associated protein [unclassified Polaromonas]AYQ30171.1 HPF/RaiA family ribosome-associated protein [Polaromonas sp. SP1]QGJ18713.1 HPF/RaiA family ribosome-associated protein [Polaromonas sp. Pch-P]
MQVQVNSKNTLHTGESFERWASDELHASLSRFKGDITRIEVHMSDENSDKAGGLEQKRCVMEARLAHHEPLAVNHNAPNQDLAFRGASDKLKRVLDHTLGKLRDHHRDRETIRHEPAPEPGAS